MIRGTIEIMVLIVVILSALEVSRGNRVNHRNFLNGSKFFYDQHDQLSNRDHRIRSYCIVTKRDRSHLIMLPNRGDRDRSWTRQTHSVVMCCDLPRSVTICYSLSGPIAQDLTRLAHDQIRVDTRRCE